MRNVKLHGHLAEQFGADWQLEIATPNEAFQALAANCPNFLSTLIQSDKDGIGYRIIRGDTDLDVHNLCEPLGRQTLHIVPVVSGGKSKLGMIVIGAALIVASGGLSAAPFVAGATTGFGAMSVASITFNIGLGLVLGGIAQMLVKTPQPPAASLSPETLQSHYFNGPSNNSGQGSPIPIGYGEVIVGSMPLSAEIYTENML